MNNSFEKDFEELAGFPPYKWQISLFHDYFVKGEIPSLLDIPTGLGKTSVMLIWYLALKAGAKVPRRLVYVVDRRAVVDQATTVANSLQSKLKDSKLCVSTLRGRYIDNKEWLDSPSMPAVIVGTIDMIGSRILFSGYGMSNKMRPYHAGLLGVDALIVLDEAHLVPPFEKLIETIANGSHVFGPKQQGIVPPLKLLSLSATGRDSYLGEKKIFRLLRDHLNDPSVKERLEASKELIIRELDDEPELVQQIAERAINLADEPPARVLVYCDRRKDALKVKEKIDGKYKREKRKHISELLVGSRRVLERETLYKRLNEYGYLGNNTSEPPTHPTFLIATSAGEVGVDLDADHMVCDLVEWERMVQRFGRVNRKGRGDASIEIIAAPRRKKPATQEQIKEWEQEWKERLSRLRKPLDCLPVTGANTGAILKLKEQKDVQKAIEDATTQPPLHPALTRALVDAWSLTSLDNHTGRPEIQPWLRGWEDNPQPQTSIVWRRHLPVRTGNGTKAKKEEIEGFFEAAPPHATERLETETYRVFDWFIERAKNLFKNQFGHEETILYILSPSMGLRGELDTKTLMEYLQKNNKEARKEFTEKLSGATVIVNMHFAGLSEDGMLDPEVSTLPRVIDDDQEWLPQPSDGPPDIRFRVRSVKEYGHQSDENWRERMRFDLEKTQEGEVIRWLIVEKWLYDAETEDDRSTGQLQELAEHQDWTRQRVRALANAMALPDRYIDMLSTAARLHDEGKRHPLWQQSVKAPKNGIIYAKTDRPMNTKLLKGYRHEFGSLDFVRNDAEFKSLPSDLKDLVLHLVAAHHGRARPVISTSGGYSPPSVLEEHACEIALSFARLQKLWGPWGLAWWETLLRAADHQASRDNNSPGKNCNCTASERGNV